MTLFLNQNEHDNFSSVSQDNFQNRESLFNSFGIIKSNHNYFTMLYNCGWILKLSKAKQWFSVLKMSVSDGWSDRWSDRGNSWDPLDLKTDLRFIIEQFFSKFSSLLFCSVFIIFRVHSIYSRGDFKKNNHSEIAIGCIKIVFLRGSSEERFLFEPNF